MLYPMNGSTRYEEIDVIRGIAVFMMVIFHAVFDLSFFGISAIEVSTGFWRSFALATASLFLLLAGISLTISDARAGKKHDVPHRFLRSLKRGATIFGLGLLVTLATWLYLKEGYVIFGILHLIGISIILGWFFLRLGKWNLPLGIAWIITGVAIVSQIRGPLALAWIGMYPGGFSSVDYTPLFPWFGVFLAGIGLGTLLYPGGKREWQVPRLNEPIARALAFPGRHSLIIYLVHQPVILFIIQLTTGTRLLF